MPHSSPSSSIPPRSTSPSTPASEGSRLSQNLEKPAIPYTRGQTFTIFRHTPPPPLGKPYPNSHTFTDIDTIQDMSQFEWCLRAPPLGGSTVYNDVSSFTITKELAVRDGHGAQVVAVDNGLVAKIYDPLYYPSHYEWTSIRADVVECTELDYSKEAATYEDMDSRFGGTIVPKYHGSWTFEVPVDTIMGFTKRPVRLILIEFIEGVTMLSLQPDKLSDEQKSNIMVKAINALDALHHHGIVHKDFAPRNVMCSGNDLASPRLRVVLIDFNQSMVRRLTTLPPRGSRLLKSPISRFWSRGPYEFSPQWIPSPRGEWLWKHWGDSPLYEPVVRGQEEKPTRPPP